MVQLMRSSRRSDCESGTSSPKTSLTRRSSTPTGGFAPSDGWCKEGVDIAYGRTWGYQGPVDRLAGQHRRAVVPGQPQRQPASHEQADVYLDKAAALCRRAGFRRITFRGDSKFGQTKHLDHWDQNGIRFIFGIDARSPNLKDLADRLPDLQYNEVERPARYTIEDGDPANPGSRTR